MNFNELTEKYKALLSENKNLKDKIKHLENQLSKNTEVAQGGAKKIIKDRSQLIKPTVPADVTKSKHITKLSSPKQKINLFKSLFKGREDVFATRWENSKKGISGYSPGFQTKHSSEICHYRPENCLVRQHQPPQLRQRRREYDAD
jgi:hypothetical protein